MAELAALRAAKQALDEGLITATDFDCVKVAFLRAQQIKAGLDAGFIKPEVYDKAVNAYLHAMEFQLLSATPSLSAPTPAAAPAGGPTPPATAAAYTAAAAAGQAAGAGAAASMPPPAARPPAPSLASAGNTVQLLASRNSSSGSGLNAAASPRGPRASALASASASGGTELLAPASNSGPLSNQASVVSDDGGACELPADLPDYCRGATAGKKSMSGIAIDGGCVNLFMHMKTRSSFKWLIFKVDSSGRTVVPDRIGGRDASYSDFVVALPDNQCRYGVYDYEYRSPERGVFKKLVFLLWAPDTCGTRSKMMYASTKDFFKGFLDGIGAELQANEPSELSEDEIKQRVVDSMTRK